MVGRCIQVNSSLIGVTSRSFQMIELILSLTINTLICIPLFFLYLYIRDQREERRRFKKLAKLYAKCTSPSKKRWYMVEEALPEPYRWVLIYSEVFNSYNVGYLDPRIGWAETKFKTYKDVTAWCDDELFLPYEATGQLNEELARELGLL